MGQALKLAGGTVNRKARYLELDKLIRDAAITFVKTGHALLEMRDQHYFEEGGYRTWDDYVNSVQEMTARHAQRIIRSTMVYAAISSGDPKGRNELPESERHCRVIADKVATWKNEKRKRADGSGVWVPVGIRNPDVVAATWGQVVEKYDKQRQRDLEAHPDHVPRKLTQTFVYDALPSRYKVGDTPISHMAGDSRPVAVIQRRINAVLDLIDKNHMRNRDKMKDMIDQDNWTKDDMDGFRDALKECAQYIESARAAVKGIRV